MTKEEFLIPRYQVVADYPGRPETMPIGHIIYLDKGIGNKRWHEYSEQEPIHLDEGLIRFAAILKKLEWWQERDAQDLHDIKYGKIIHEELFFKIEGIGGYIPYEYFIPATEEEYLKYIKPKQTNP